MATPATVKQQAQNTQLVTVEEYIKKNEHLIVRALNNTISPERFLAVINIVMQSPALTGCSQNSLVAAVLQTVQIGLTPGPVGQVYYVPFYKGSERQVQMIIGYRGFVELINRSKEATVLSAFVVYEKDYFEYENGLNPVLKHRPFAGDRGGMIGAYCIAKNNIANEKVFIYIQKEEIEKVKNESLNKIAADKRSYSPWVKWEESMWMKTAVRRIAKLLPLSVEIQQSIEADETIKTSISPRMTDQPDKTDWNTATDAETVEQTTVKPTEQAQDKPQSTQKPKEGESWQDEADKAISEFNGEIVSEKSHSLNDLGVGDEIAEFQGIIRGLNVRENIGKKKDKTITEYKVEDASGVEHIVGKWGSPKDGTDEGVLATFICVKRGEDFKGTKKFMAQDIVIN